MEILCSLENEGAIATVTNGSFLHLHHAVMQNGAMIVDLVSARPHTCPTCPFRKSGLSSLHDVARRCHKHRGLMSVNAYSAPSCLLLTENHGITTYLRLVQAVRPKGGLARTAGISDSSKLLLSHEENFSGTQH